MNHSYNIALPAGMAILFAVASDRSHAQTQTPCNGSEAYANPAVTLSWTAVPGAGIYQVEVCDEPTFFIGEVWFLPETNLLSQTTGANTVIPGTTYYWHIRSNIDGIWGADSNPPCAFVASSTPPLTAPALSQPADGTAGHVPTNVQLSWMPVSGATGYQVQVAENSGFTLNPQQFDDPASPYTYSGLAGKTYYWRIRAVNGTVLGPWSASRSLYTQSVATTLNLKVFLQGPLVTGTMLMNEGLVQIGSLPLAEPYTALGFTGIWNTGASVSPTFYASQTGNNRIVDWVYVELRHGTTNVPLYKHVMLVQRDGDVVTTTGAVPSLVFPMASAKVSVRHRNHLGVMAANNVTANGTPITIDLTQTSTTLYGTNPTATVNTTRRALWAGDTSGDGNAKYTGTGNDRDPILTAIGSATPTATLTGQYSRLDTNMDGTVKYTGSGNDRDPILVTVGGTTPNNTRAQQLP